MTQQYDRKTYKGPEVGLPELELFGWMNTSSASYSKLRTHVHENAFEVSFIARGSVRWWVGDKVYQLKRGSVYITRPDEPHGGIDGVMHPCELYWLILPVPRSGSLPGLCERNCTTDEQHVIDGVENVSFIARTEKLFKATSLGITSARSMSVTVTRGVLHQILVQLVRDHDDALDVPGYARHSAAISKSMRWVTEHIGEDILVAEMANSAKIGVSRFHERFLQEVGLTPSDYLAQMRIQRAQELLANSTQSVSSIGFDLGFASSQYFATVFKKFVGVSPQGYRAARLAGAGTGDEHERSNFLTESPTDSHCAAHLVASIAGNSLSETLRC